MTTNLGNVCVDHLIKYPFYQCYEKSPQQETSSPDNQKRRNVYEIMRRECFSKCAVVKSSICDSDTPYRWKNAHG